MSNFNGERLQSKFKTVGRPFDFPGKCASCGASDRACIDLGLSIEVEGSGYGVLYLCVSCVTQLASFFGLSSVVDKKIQLEKFVACLQEVRTKLDELSTMAMDTINNIDFALSFEQQSLPLDAGSVLSSDSDNTGSESENITGVSGELPESSRERPKSFSL